MKEAQLKIGQEVLVNVSRGKIILEPTTRKKYELEELVACITSSNTHAKSHFLVSASARKSGNGQEGCAQLPLPNVLLIIRRE